MLATLLFSDPKQNGGMEWDVKLINKCSIWDSTQNSRDYSRRAVPYLEYTTQDRKATQLGPLHQIRLPRMRLSLVPYSKYPFEIEKLFKIKQKVNK